MIDLTPLDVRKKKGDFRHKVRGYDPELVDDFLDMVADRLEALVRENIELSERAQRLEERVTGFGERERALNDALMSAQEFREGLRGQASREADLKLREAEAEADLIRAGAHREREREEETLRRVRARRHQLVESFRAMLEREMRALEAETEALELADPTPRTGESARPFPPIPSPSPKVSPEPGPSGPSAGAHVPPAAAEPKPPEPTSPAIPPTPPAPSAPATPSEPAAPDFGITATPPFTLIEEDAELPTFPDPYEGGEDLLPPLSPPVDPPAASSPPAAQRPASSPPPSEPPLSPQWHPWEDEH